MNHFIRETYGDPCRGCGFVWSISAVDAAATITAAPTKYQSLTAGHSGQEAVATLAWNLSSYVCHAADNTRIWAERVAGPALGVTEPIAPYDEDALAVARSYSEIALPAALWSLERAVGDWAAARALGGTGFLHPQQGPLSTADAERIVAHELLHHALDVQRIVVPRPSG